MPTDTLKIDETKKRLELQLEERQAAANELRAKTEAGIAGVLTLADEAARFWEATWKRAFVERTRDRQQDGEILRSVLKDAEQKLQEVLNCAQQHAHIFQGTLARLDELEDRGADFSLWVRECLARWEMLDHPMPKLDREQIARAQAAYARGECEDVADVLARVLAGGPLVKE